MLKLFLTFLILLMPIVSESETMEASIGKQNIYISSGTVHGGEITVGKDIRNIRWGKHKTFERIVLDIYESAKGSPAKVPCYFKVEYEQHPFRLVFTLSGVQKFSATFPKYTGSELISDMYRITSDDSKAMFAVALKKPVEYELFELHNPGMIVVDIRQLKTSGLKIEDCKNTSITKDNTSFQSSIVNRQSSIEKANRRSSGHPPKEAEDGRKISKQGSFIGKEIAIDLLPWLIVVLVLAGIAFVVYFLNKRLQDQIDRSHSSRKVNEHKPAENFSEMEEDINLQKIFDQTNNAMYVVDGDFNIIKVNQPLLKIFNLSEEEALGRKCYKVLYKREKICKNCPAMDTFKSGKVVHMEESTISTDGKIEYFDVQTVPVFNEEGNVIQVINYARDITEQKKTEEKLRKTNDQQSDSETSHTQNVYTTLPIDQTPLGFRCN